MAAVMMSCILSDTTAQHNCHPSQKMLCIGPELCARSSRTTPKTASRINPVCLGSAAPGGNATTHPKGASTTTETRMCTPARQGVRATNKSAQQTKILTSGKEPATPQASGREPLRELPASDRACSCGNLASASGSGPCSCVSQPLHAKLLRGRGAEHLSQET